MELVRITGSRADLLALRGQPEVQVVAASAIDRGDGSWLVSAYVPDGGAGALKGGGLTVEPLKDAGALRADWTAARAPAEAAAARGDSPAGYLTSTAIAERVQQLASDHPDICSVAMLPNRTHEGREVPYVRVGTGSAKVLVIGGVHAREWAPPDSLLSLAEGLVRAYAGGDGIDHPEWVDRTATPPITYAAWSVPAADVKRIVEGAALLLIPVVNPDGRDYSIGPANDDEHRMWRKNRRPPEAGHSGPWCTGVDLNRNFDVAWDFERYYNEEAAGEVMSTKDSCDPQVYIGPSAASEPETLNVQWLVEDQRPVHFMDVHSYARDILFPWGMDDDQGADPAQSWHNDAWDRDGEHGGRDGLGGSYGEFLAADLAARHHALARRMRDAMRDQAGSDGRARHRSTYTIKQALGLYPTTGTSDDYCLRVTTADDSLPPIHAFCLECGIDRAPDDPTDDEGGFHPDHRLKFPKIEREVHAAVLALTRAAL